MATKVQKVKVVGAVFCTNTPTIRGLVSATTASTKELNWEKLVLYSTSLRSEVDQFIASCEAYVKAHADNPARG